MLELSCVEHLWRPTHWAHLETLPAGTKFYCVNCDALQGDGGVAIYRIAPRPAAPGPVVPEPVEDGVRVMSLED